jgi:hypothetical protein
LFSARSPANRSNQRITCSEVIKDIEAEISPQRHGGHKDGCKPRIYTNERENGK